MNKEKIKELAKDPKFIPGIYNYCDRWCERCAFTSRCFNYEMGEEEFSDAENHDLNSEAFWKKISETFKATLELLEEMAEEQGIDLSSLDLEDAAHEPKQDRDVAKNHECSRAAKIYANMVDKWFNSAKILFKEKDEELNMKAELELPNSDPFVEAEVLEDALEVIQWHQHQIYVKISRALLSKMEEKREAPDEFPKDSDGSAKVALIAMDRSIAAWGRMLEYFPEREDDLLKILVHLERLRRKTEQVFLNARAFVRPGFDE